MLLHFRMRVVEHVPWTTTPATKRYAIGAERLAVCILHEPIPMLLEDVRLFLGDERCNPDRGLEAARADLLQHALDVSAERRTRLEPVAHCRLVAVVDLHVTQTGRVLRDEVEIVEDLLGRDARTEAVPRAPAGRW